jgi:SAM-dependent methyltransferase
MNNSNFENYFNARGVSSSYYDSYELPPYLRVVLGHDKTVSILDFGCGFGQNISAIKRLGYKNVCGYDIEPAALDFCKKNSIDVIDGRLVSVDHLNDQYDIILLTHVLEHIPKNEIVHTLEILRRAVKGNGFVFISVPNAQSNTGCYWMYEDFTHQTLFTAGSLIYVLTQAGFLDITLHDRDCLIGVKWWKSILRKYFLFFYRANKSFWNKVTVSSYHAPSPIVNSYEVKVIAKR